MSLEKVTEAAEGKVSLLKRPMMYIVKAIMGGIFISLGVIAAYSAANVVYPINANLAPIMVALMFPVALISIIFFQGELFTTGVFIMGVGALDRKTSVRGGLKVWVTCYFVNFITIFTMISLWCLTKSHPKGMFTEFVTAALNTRLGFNIPQLIFRGALCNFVVCWAYYVALKMKGDAAKFLMIFLCVFVFVISGLEHCIANMGFLTVGLYIMEDFPIMDALRNLLFSTIGNIIGGFVLLAVPVYFLERKKLQ